MRDPGIFDDHADGDRRSIQAFFEHPGGAAVPFPIGKAQPARIVAENRLYLCFIRTGCARFHDSLGHQYESLSESAAEPRLKMMPDYLAQHEHEMRAGLVGFLETASFSVLNTWFRQVPDLPQPDPLEAMRCCLLCCASVDDAENAARAFHSQLQDTYQQLADLSETTPLHELFALLVKDEYADLRRMVRDTARLDSP